MTTTGRLLVTGGTGTLGRIVVGQAQAAGTAVRILSRRPSPAAAGPDRAGRDRPGQDRVEPDRVEPDRPGQDPRRVEQDRAEPGRQLVEPEWATADLTTGAGLAAALDRVTTIVHCASDPGTPGADLKAAEQLLAAARDERPHLVYISIVGIDRVPLRYYREKLAVERLIEDSDIPWTILRATQFHDLVLALLQRIVRLPVVPVPAGTSVQPVDAAEVAAHLLRLAKGAPAGRAADLGGPEIRTVVDLARSYLRHAGRRRPVLPVRLPGALARAYREGGLLAPDRAGGGTTWEQFLAAR